MAERMPDVTFSNFTGTSRRAGAFLRPTLVQAWIKGQIHRLRGHGFYLVEDHNYRPPTSEEILAAFIQGCRDEVVGVDLDKVVALVNKHCGTSFDPAEVVWWRVGLEEERYRQRASLLHGMHAALGRMVVERGRREREARMVTITYRYDPDDVTQCPCCGRDLGAYSIPTQQRGVQPLSHS
ncbi:hypothetical protein [Streptomyces celluloflavus]|uniref:hypothetical protein n=1 Tax=Streptomyces celluloflavus TaxID=58344 RepID=UPI00345F56AE